MPGAQNEIWSAEIMEAIQEDNFAALVYTLLRFKRTDSVRAIVLT